MKKSLIIFLIIGLAAFVVPVAAKNRGNDGGGVSTDTRILYHAGPIMQGTSDVYLIWYGNWAGNPATEILVNVAAGLGSSPFLRINTTYPAGNGVAPNGAVIYAGSANDAYSRGTNLTLDDIQRVIENQLEDEGLPLDTAGIYLVITPADITNTIPNGSGHSTTWDALNFLSEGVSTLKGEIR